MLKNTLAMPRTLLAAALLAAASAPALAVEAFTAQYNASALGMVGEGQMSVSPQPGNRWQYTLSVRNQAVDLSQKTVFDVQDGRMRPLSSSDTSRLLIKKKNVNTVYDWSKAQATWSGDVKPDRAGPVKLAAGDMDALLVNLAIVRDVAAGKPLTYRMVENGRAKPMTYQVAGKERITVAGKPRGWLFPSLQGCDCRHRCRISSRKCGAIWARHFPHLLSPAAVW